VGISAQPHFTITEMEPVKQNLTLSLQERISWISNLGVRAHSQFKLACVAIPFLLRSAALPWPSADRELDILRSFGVVGPCFNFHISMLPYICIGDQQLMEHPPLVMTLQIGSVSVLPK